MRKRLSILVWLVLGWGFSAFAQNTMPRVGILTVDANVEQFIAPFRNTLREKGYVEGKNVAFVLRHGGGDPRNLTAPAAELVQMKVDLLFPAGPPAVRAAFAATHEIPIIAHDLETDPVAAGYAQSYSRPGKNLTGLFLDSSDLAGKWLELLHSIIPHFTRAVVVWDATSGPVPLQAVQDTAPKFGIKLQVLTVHTPEEINALPRLFRARPQALIFLPSPMMWFQSARLAELSKTLKLPATSMFGRFAEAGGMLAYGPEMANTSERCAELAAKVLNGAKPGDLPIERPTKFELLINMRTAKAVRVRVPDAVLIRADKVIR